GGDPILSRAADGIVLIKYGAAQPGVPFINPIFQPLSDGALLPGAQLKFFVDGEIARSFADGEARAPHSHPVLANAGGYFPPIYLDDEAYVVQLKSAAGAVISGPSDN